MNKKLQIFYDFFTIFAKFMDMSNTQFNQRKMRAIDQSKS